MNDAAPTGVFRAAYSDRSMDLTRYATDPLDESIATIVRELERRDHAAWAAQQTLLTEGDSDTLRAFANRRAALALRTGRPEFAEEGVHAIALLNTRGLDPRDRTADFPIYALHHTGGDVAAVLAFAVPRADPGMRGYFPKGRGPKNPTLRGCGYIEVYSRHGLGFMETWSRPAPRLPGLPAAAVAIADRMDAGGRYAVVNLHLGSLPKVWFGFGEPAGEVKTFGCVGLHATLRGGQRWRDDVLVFFAEVDDAATARALVDLARGASRPERPRDAASSGSILLLVAGPQHDGASHSTPESQESVASLAHDLAEAAFVSADRPT